jgi:hypothetical protein
MAPFIAILVVVSVVLLTLAFSGEHSSEELAGLRRARVANVRDGELVKIVGRVRCARAPVTSPLGGRIGVSYLSPEGWPEAGPEKDRVGVYCYVTVGHEIEEGHYGAKYHSRASMRLAVDFFVEDETGNALVHGIDAEVQVERRLFSVADWETGRELILAMTDGEEPLDGLSPHLRIVGRELLLEEGAEVSVVGIASWEDAPSRRLVLGGDRVVVTATR